MSEFTKDQWREEMAESAANECGVMTYEAWVNYRTFLADLFDEIKGVK
tara:strand:- start:33 stop:176 length:144 start_codon:yes stop_codon:yes gene_type:complete